MNGMNEANEGLTGFKLRDADLTEQIIKRRDRLDQGLEIIGKLVVSSHREVVDRLFLMCFSLQRATQRRLSGWIGETKDLVSAMEVVNESGRWRRKRESRSSRPGSCCSGRAQQTNNNKTSKTAVAITKTQSGKSRPSRLAIGWSIRHFPRRYLKAS
jgi:hypothetical protein